MFLGSSFGPVFPLPRAAKVRGLPCAAASARGAPAPLAGAVITARGPALMVEQSTVTDDAGAFEITMLPPGAYALAVQAEGFLPFSTEGLVVKGRRIKVRLLLMPEPRPAPPPPAPV